MENKHIAVIVVGGIALTVLTHFLVKHYMAQTVVTPDATPVAQASQTGSSAIPAYTPTGNAYQPLPVGAILPGSETHSTQTPPGVTDVSVLLPANGLPKTKGDAGAALHEYLAGLTATDPGTTTNDPTTTAVSNLTGNAAVIDSRYMALFGRHAEQAGMDFWKNAMDTGAVNLQSLDMNLTRGAQAQDQAAEVRINPDAVIKYRG